MILYIENPKEFTRMLLEVITEFSKVAGHKIKTQKSVMFLYTSSKQYEKEIRIAIPVTITKRIKSLGINLTKEVKYRLKKLKREFPW